MLALIMTFVLGKISPGRFAVTLKKGIFLVKSSDVFVVGKRLHVM